MTKTLLLASTALFLSAASAFAGDEPQVAQAPVPTGPAGQAPLADATQRGVLVFTPDFFAAQRPNTALDMVNRVPGFEVDDGSGARGFEGAVGNVLINNARPASKNDGGSNVLSRTPARQVERIELIRGGAPGIDMQGFSVVVNVILKTEASRQSILTWNTTQFEGAGQDHGLQAATKCLGVQARIPRPDGVSILVQHPDQSKGVIAHLIGRRRNLRPIHGSGGVHRQMAKIRRVARPTRGFRHAQRKGATVLLAHFVVHAGVRFRSEDASVFPLDV